MVLSTSRLRLPALEAKQHPPLAQPAPRRCSSTLAPITQHNELSPARGDPIHSPWVYYRPSETYTTSTRSTRASQAPRRCPTRPSSTHEAIPPRAKSPPLRPRDEYRLRNGEPQSSTSTMSSSPSPFRSCSGSLTRSRDVRPVGNGPYRVSEADPFL